MIDGLIPPAFLDDFDLLETEWGDPGEWEGLSDDEGNDLLAALTDRAELPVGAAPDTYWH